MSFPLRVSSSPYAKPQSWLFNQYWGCQESIRKTHEEQASDERDREDGLPDGEGGSTGELLVALNTDGGTHATLVCHGLDCRWSSRSLSVDFLEGGFKFVHKGAADNAVGANHCRSLKNRKEQEL